MKQSKLKVQAVPSDRDVDLLAWIARYAAIVARLEGVRVEKYPEAA